MFKEPFFAKTYVTRPTRIAHIPSEGEVLNYFLEPNHTSGHVSIEDYSARIVTIDIAIIPEFIEALMVIHNTHLANEEKNRLERRQRELELLAKASNKELGGVNV